VISHKLTYFCPVNRLISISLMFLFMFSISSFSVEIMYCKGEITDISFFGPAECDKCSFPKRHSKCKMKKCEKKNCCTTELIIHKASTDIQKVDQFELSDDLPGIITVLTSDLGFFVAENQTEFSHHVLESPPDRAMDFQSLYQTFLI